MVAIKMSYDTDIELKEFEDMIKLAIDLKIDVLKLINQKDVYFTNNIITHKLHQNTLKYKNI